MEIKSPLSIDATSINALLKFMLARRFLGYNPAIRLIEVENAGNCAHGECPEQVNQELLNWIQMQVLQAV